MCYNTLPDGLSKQVSPSTPIEGDNSQMPCRGILFFIKLYMYFSCEFIWIYLYMNKDLYVIDLNVLLNEWYCAEIACK